MIVHVLKPVRTDRMGRLAKGTIVDLPDSVAKIFLQQGAVEFYETKVIRENPLPTVGATSPSLASPAVPASTQVTSKPSRRGKKAATNARS